MIAFLHVCMYLSGVHNLFSAIFQFSAVFTFQASAAATWLHFSVPIVALVLIHLQET